MLWRGQVPACYSESDCLQIFFLWCGETYAQGDFVKMRPPADGDQFVRYYTDKDMADAERDGHFVGDKASLSFREEGYIAGPISELRLHFGVPGILVLWMRIPTPVKDSEAHAALAALTKVWTPLAIGFRTN